MTDGILALWAYVLLGIPLIMFVRYLRNRKPAGKSSEEKNDKRNSRE